MNKNTKVNSNKKKEIIRKMKTEKSRNHAFQRVAKHVGRGVKESLKRMHVKYEEVK